VAAASRTICSVSYKRMLEAFNGLELDAVIALNRFSVINLVVLDFLWNDTERPAPRAIRFLANPILAEYALTCD